MKSKRVFIVLGLLLAVGCGSKGEGDKVRTKSQPAPVITEKKKPVSAVQERLKNEGFDPKNADAKQVEDMMFGGGN